MKKIIRLTENDLHRIVKNSVKRIMKESYDSNEHNQCQRLMYQMCQKYGADVILAEFGNCMGYDEWCGYVKELARRKGFLNDNNTSTASQLA